MIKHMPAKKIEEMWRVLIERAGGASIAKLAEWLCLFDVTIGVAV